MNVIFLEYLFIQNYKKDIKIIKSDEKFIISDKIPQKLLDQINDHLKTPATQKDIAQIIQTTKEEFLSKNLFNGKKLGLYSFVSKRSPKSEKQIIEIKLFKTDYFTHKIMKKIIQNHKIKNSVFIDRPYFFFTAFGLNIFLTKNNKTILTLRKNKKLSPTVSEGIIPSDIKEGFLNIEKLIQRALMEEIGPIHIENYKLLDFFLVKTNLDFGLSVEVSTKTKLKECIYLPAKDKAKESAGHLIINLKKYKKKEDSVSYLTDILRSYILRKKFY